jgi:dihydrofolate reductase
MSATTLLHTLPCRKVILYIASSLDGYIAKPNDDLSFLNLVHKENEDYGYNDFIKTVDTVILGRKTYDWVMKQVPVFPHTDKKTYVITRVAQPNSGNIVFYTESLKELITKLKQEPGTNIFCDGGAEVVNLLLQERLIDEFIISIIPVLLGAGTKLFQTGYPEQNIKLLSVKHFDTGLTQLHYECI